MKINLKIIIEFNIWNVLINEIKFFFDDLEGIKVFFRISIFSNINYYCI